MYVILVIVSPVLSVLPPHAFSTVLVCTKSCTSHSFSLPFICRMLGVCGMHPDHQEALKKNRVVLAKQLLLGELLEHLLEKDIITLEMREHIQVSRGKRGKPSKLAVEVGAEYDKVGKGGSAFLSQWKYPPAPEQLAENRCGSRITGRVSPVHVLPIKGILEMDGAIFRKLI